MLLFLLANLIWIWVSWSLKYFFLPPPSKYVVYLGSSNRPTEGKTFPTLILHISFPQFTVATTLLQYSAMAAETNGRPIDPITANGRPNGQVVERRPRGKKTITQSRTSQWFGWFARWVSITNLKIINLTEPACNLDYSSGIPLSRPSFDVHHLSTVSTTRLQEYASRI